MLRIEVQQDWRTGRSVTPGPAIVSIGEGKLGELPILARTHQHHEVDRLLASLQDKALESPARVGLVDQHLAVGGGTSSEAMIFEAEWMSTP